MADLSSDLAGIRSPNPFWLASAPPTNSGYQVMRAFAAGWGGAVWKTLGDPIVNVTSRFAGLNLGATKMIGMNNIELITDRPLEDNLREIAECKAAFPDRAIVASLMTDCTQKAWHELINAVQTVPVDGFELNFGCPHGMSERGMGSAVGQDPELVEQITRWTKEAARVPVIVKLTPNITDVRYTARAAARGGADAISLINTINSLMGVDLGPGIRSRTSTAKVRTADICGPAVKPIALNMVGDCARDPQVRVPISGIGGDRVWRDCGRVHADGLDQRPGLYRGHARRFPHRRRHDRRPQHLPRRARPRVGRANSWARAAIRFDWKNLNLDYRSSPRSIRKRASTAASATSRAKMRRTSASIEAWSTGRRNHDRSGPLRWLQLCSMVCPVDECITMVHVDSGLASETWKERSSKISASCPRRAFGNGYPRWRRCHGDRHLAADVLIEGGVIAGLASRSRGSGHTSSTTRARYVFPGGVDPHTHLDMPFGGTITADDFESGTRAASLGGTTTIVDFALHTKGDSLHNALKTWQQRPAARRAATTRFTLRSPTAATKQ